ncbi:hypothetical protein Misp01_63550 [Microtetraspora sp. NBRC 13810]|nr:hypothetical protein Misp01_63550 [Microtetraspora sp. NBRC 13810]
MGVTLRVLGKLRLSREGDHGRMHLRTRVLVFLLQRLQLRLQRLTFSARLLGLASRPGFSAWLLGQAFQSGFSSSASAGRFRYSRQRIVSLFAREELAGWDHDLRRRTLAGLRAP